MRSCSLVTGVLSLAGVLEIWHLVVLAVLYGASEAFFGPAFGALVPEIVAPRHLVEANSLEQLVRQAGERLLGPAVGGFVVAAVGAGGAFLDRRGHLHHQRRVHLGAARALAAGGRHRALGAPRAGRGRHLRALAAVAVGHAGGGIAEPAAASSARSRCCCPSSCATTSRAGAWGYGAILSAAGAGSVLATLIVSQRGPPRRYLTFAYGAWILATVPFIGYAFGTTVWQLMAFAVVFGAGETAGMVVWGTLMSSRVPPELRGRVHSLDWFVSIGLTPLSFALTGPVSKAIGTDATLVLAGVLPMVVCAVLFVVAGLRRDEDLHPLLGEGYAGVGASSAESGQRHARDLVGLGLVERLLARAGRGSAPPGGGARAR